MGEGLVWLIVAVVCLLAANRRSNCLLRQANQAVPDQKHIRGARLSYVGRTHGQCDARPAVTFPAAEHHRPLTGTKLYFLVSRGSYV